jgi:hypothetical protein
MKWHSIFLPSTAKKVIEIKDPGFSQNNRLVCLWQEQNVFRALKQLSCLLEASKFYSGGGLLLRPKQ